MRPNLFRVYFRGLIRLLGSFRQAQADDKAPKPIELAVSGQPIETSVAKYRLLPIEPELHAGNAAPILLRIPWDNADYFASVEPTFAQWETKPLDDPSWRESKGVLHESFYDEMKRAAFRRDASWEYPIGEVPNVSGILLPDIQGSRTIICGGLVARIRYHLGRREFEQAPRGFLSAWRCSATTPRLRSSSRNSSRSRIRGPCSSALTRWLACPAAPISIGH